MKIDGVRYSYNKNLQNESSFKNYTNNKDCFENQENEKSNP